MLVDIVPILLLVLDEAETFNTISDLMQQHGSYLAISRKQHKAHLEAFRVS